MAKKAGEEKISSGNNENMQKILIDNSVQLQRVLTNLSINLDNLSKQISKLLNLFEVSAKNIAEKDFQKESANKKMMDKLEEISSQNKTLAQGVSLVHEKIAPEEETSQPIQNNLPQMRNPANSLQKFNSLPKL